MVNYAFFPVLDYLAIKIPGSIPSLFAGEKKHFYCYVEGISSKTVRWLMNNTVLKETKMSHFGGEVNLTLDFPELDLHDTGNYTCEASSSNIKTKKHTILVTVTCKHLSLTRLFSHLTFLLKNGHNFTPNERLIHNHKNSKREMTC